MALEDSKYLSRERTSSTEVAATRPGTVLIASSGTIDAARLKPSSGQLKEDEGREPISPAIPGEGIKYIHRPWYLNLTKGTIHPRPWKGWGFPPPNPLFL
jgi:hypothetical protein